jgi:hypothetical protein
MLLVAPPLWVLVTILCFALGRRMIALILVGIFIFLWLAIGAGHILESLQTPEYVAAINAVYDCEREKLSNGGQKALAEHDQWVAHKDDRNWRPPAPVKCPTLPEHEWKWSK